MAVKIQIEHPEKLIICLELFESSRKMTNFHITVTKFSVSDRDLM